MTSEPENFTIRDAARYCGVSYQSVRKRVDRGTLRVFKQHGVQMISRSELERAGLWPSAERDPRRKLERLQAENRRLQARLAARSRAGPTLPAPPPREGIASELGPPGDGSMPPEPEPTAPEDRAATATDVGRAAPEASQESSEPIDERANATPRAVPDSTGDAESPPQDPEPVTPSAPSAAASAAMETEPAPVGAAEGQPAEAPSRDERAPAADTGRQERSDREASERTPVIHPALQVLLGMLVYALVVVAAPMYRALPPIRPELIFLLFLIPLHLGCGMAVGRRWASVVPLVGAVALLLAGIGGLTGSALFALLVATAAITAGVYLREILDRARLGRDGRWPLSTMIAGGLLAFSLIPGLWSLIQQLRPPERRPAAPQRVDERDATFLGVGLGDSARDVVRVFGRPQPRGETTPAPTMDAEQVGTPPVFRRPDPGEGPAPPVVGYRYPGRATFLLSGGRVYAFTVTVPTAESVRGVGIGDGLERVRQAYPDARCSVDPPASTLLGAPYCLVPLSAGRIMRFGQNPIASIAVSATPLR